MQWPSNKADVLRAVGHVLDTRDAKLVRVEEDDRYLTVRAIRSGIEEEMAYSSADLQALLTEARARRGKDLTQVRSGYEEKLRVVGQQLDRKFGRVIRFDHRDGSFVLTYLPRESGRTRLILTASVMEDLMDIAPRQRAGHEERRRLGAF